MKRWLQDLIGRWQTQRIRTKKIRDMYRTCERNQAILENGGAL